MLPAEMGTKAGEKEFMGVLRDKQATYCYLLCVFLSFGTEKY